MLKIGDFARMSRVSVKALRYYDGIGLLPPARVDHATGYRYYSTAQLPVLNRLMIYKNLGFSLSETRALLDEACSPGRVRALFQARQAELARHIRIQTAQLAEVTKRLKEIECEEISPRYNVVIRDAEPCEVISVRRILPD